MNPKKQERSTRRLLATHTTTTKRACLHAKNSSLVIYRPQLRRTPRIEFWRLTVALGWQVRATAGRPCPHRPAVSFPARSSGVPPRARSFRHHARREPPPAAAPGSSTTGVRRGADGRPGLLVAAATAAYGDDERRDAPPPMPARLRRAPRPQAPCRMRTALFSPALFLD